MKAIKEVRTVSEISSVDMAMADLVIENGKIIKDRFNWSREIILIGPGKDIYTGPPRETIDYD